MNKVDEKLLKKLPKYAQEWEWIYLEKTYDGSAGIDANCKASKDDPEQGNIVFVCDNWEEFIWWVRQYKKEFRTQHREEN